MNYEAGNDPQLSDSKLNKSVRSEKSIKSHSIGDTVRSAKNAFDMTFPEEDTVLFEWYNINFQVPVDGEDVKDRLPGAQNN